MRAIEGRRRRVGRGHRTVAKQSGGEECVPASFDAFGQFCA